MTDVYPEIMGIKKTPTGIPGFDEITGGGLPRGRTSLLEGSDAEAESSLLRISTIADTWTHLTFIVQAGESNRALTIVKSRGTRHSRQVRELIMSDNGLEISDVYTAGGEVLMGTLRYEKEMADKDQLEHIAEEIERKYRELELAEAELNARQVDLQRDMEVKRIELEQLEKEQKRQRRSGLRIGPSCTACAAEMILRMQVLM
jgi:circadian clock protein KaiC